MSRRFKCGGSFRCDAGLSLFPPQGVPGGSGECLQFAGADNWERTMRFYVYRTGWNGANNSSSMGGPARVRVAEVEADSARDACDLAAERVSCYNGQFFSAVEADSEDMGEAKIDAAVTVLD